MKLPLLLVFVLIAAGCRQSDPDQAPPVGDAATAVAAGTASAPAGIPAVPSTVESGFDVATDSFPDAAALARRSLDRHWAACEQVVAVSDCRDEAVLAYDVAMHEARTRFEPAATHPTAIATEVADVVVPEDAAVSNDESAATTEAVLEEASVAGLQVSGIRG